MSQSTELRQRRQVKGQDHNYPGHDSSNLEQHSFLLRCCTSFMYVSATFSITAAIFLCLTSSPVDPEAYRLPPARPFTGPLAVNNKLQQGKRLLEGKVVGPESLATHGGHLYTGTVDGKVIEIRDEEEINVIARLGGPGCGDHLGDEERCGRPLGVRFFDNKLHVIDAFFGLYQHDLTGGSSPVKLFSTKTNLQGHTMKFANDFEKLEDGTFLFSDTSYKWHMTEYGLLVLENRPCGRLLWHDPATNKSGVALEGLYSPNGIQLSPEKDFLLIAESTRYRITKYYTKGPKKGATEVFIDNLPGMPDNISPSHNGGYWVGFALANSRMGPLKMDLVAPLPWLRKMVAKVVDPTSLVPYMPQYGLIIELNQKGEIVQSLHDPTGQVVPSVSEVLDTGKALYLGSYHAPFLVKVDLQ